MISLIMTLYLGMSSTGIQVKGSVQLRGRKDVSRIGIDDRGLLATQAPAELRFPLKGIVFLP